jgi:tetratricopeptide (TPR) repeat protein
MNDNYNYLCKKFIIVKKKASYSERATIMKKILSKLFAGLAAISLLILALPLSYGGDPGISGQVVRDPERYYHRLKDMRAKNPDDPELTYQIANIYYSWQMEDEAIKEYRRVLRIDKNHYNSKWFLSKVLESKGYFEEAFWLVRECMEARKSDADLYLRAADLLIKMEQVDVAREYFAKVDELKYGEPDGKKPIHAVTQPTRGNWKKFFY